MKEMFDWVPWFNELAKKIAGGGQQYLDDRAREVDWHGESPLPNADAIDPLFFITVVANESGKAESRSRVFASLAEVFEIHPLESDDSPDVWHAPTSLRLFQYDNPADPANREVVWRLLRATVSGSLDAETFQSANGRLRNISWARLTTTLALMDAASHLRLSKGYPEAYGVAKVAGQPRWTDYQSRIAEARANFPGCELYEIEMFARLQSSTNEGGQNLAVHRDRCWIATTNASWRDRVGNDHTSEFHENHWLRVENSSEYAVERPEPGDLILARYGRDKGRGIGVVYRNDYGKERNPKGRIHVLWLNKRQCDFETPVQAGAFAKASENTVGTFRRRTEYVPTWNVLEGVGREMALWSHFLEVWPPDRVRDMSLEDYTNLNRSDAFVYWLEKRTEALGSIWGGSAFKFGIYRRAQTDPKEPGGGRIFGDRYAWMDKYGETEEEAFATVRTRLTDVINAARTGNLEAIDRIDFSPAVKWKVAFLYQSREDSRLLAIYKEGRLAARYKEAFPDKEEPRPSQQHAALIRHYSWLGGVLDISRRLWLDPKEQPPPSPTDRKYWLMSLGRRSSRWDTCYESGLASIGFDEHPVGDLHKYASLEEVGRAMEDVPGVDPYNTRLALWQFSNEMKPGDVIFVKRGQHDVVGHGTVSSDYRHFPARERHKHIRYVNWQSSYPRGRPVEAGHQLVNKTLTDVTRYAYLVTALKAAVGFVDGDVTPAGEEHPLNQILYGPPGTGKTYGTVSHALAIVDGAKPNAEITEPDRQRFRSLRFERAADSAPAEGRVAMVTFHQNYAYEDFVEGIRPALTPTDEGQDPTSAELGYELRPGIFRAICTAAKDAPNRNFVLIIDEINRGNIPKIFGELITLIEPSRRLGADDETTVTLSYSGHDFGVPDNLYIIGTMNTADRSIQQMDTALRRRFTFVEMMPDANHDLIPEDVDGVNCRKMLRAMNERIALLLDREHQIGHTYLLNVETMEQLADTFRNRVFPLLQEYFYDDWRKIRAVLGDNAFVRERRLDDQGTKALAEQFGHAEDDRVYERLSFSSDEWENSEQYKKIYANPKED